MKKRRRKAWCCLILSCVFFGLQAMSILLEPLTVVESSSGITKVGYVLGVLFWGFLFLAVLFFWICWSIMHKSDVYQQWKTHEVPGIVGFFRTKEAGIIDVVWLLTLALSIVGNTSKVLPHSVTLVAMSMSLFTFYLHMILNGRIYRYMTLKKRKGKESDERAY